MEVDPTNKNEVAWTSWLPALGYALAASTGPVLEIGVGHFSTPFLHEYCRGAGRALYSVESDDAWRASFDHKLGDDNHRFGYPVLNDIPDEFIMKPRWGVVFIDNSPGGEARLRPFLAFLGNSDYLVVHDYHRENEEAIKSHLAGVNHKVYSDYQPPTLLASKIRLINSHTHAI